MIDFDSNDEIGKLVRYFNKMNQIAMRNLKGELNRGNWLVESAGDDLTALIQRQRDYGGHDPAGIGGTGGDHGI